MLRNFSALAMTMALTSYAFSQDGDSTKKGNLAITGSVDAYYRYNFQNAKDQQKVNNFTSFTDTHNSFELGMASIRADYTIGRVTAVADLGFGKRAADFSYPDDGILAGVKQAYVSVNATDNLKFSMGKWATHVGYELADAYLNRNYSMSYMFSYGPFSHTGLKAELTAGNFGFMLGVANPTDLVTASFGKKWILGQASWSANSFAAYLNYQGGKWEDETQVHQVDMVLTNTFSDQFSAGVNATLQSVKPENNGGGESWKGAALYLNFDPTKVFGLTLRGEYFDDKKGVSGLTGVTGMPTSVFAATLSGNIRIDNLTIIPEFRLDNAKEEVFTKNSGDGVKSAATFILAATYHF
jgi:hypothetical protein